MGNTTFASLTLEEYAKRHKLNYDVTPLKKTIFVLIDDIAVGVAQKIYLPYDAALEKAIITGIRCGSPGNLFPSIYRGFPYPFNGHVAPNILLLADFKRFTFTLADKEAHQKIIQLPLYELLQTAAIHKWEGIRGMWRMQPENSFIQYVDTGNTFSHKVLPIVFEYHPFNQIF